MSSRSVTRRWRSRSRTTCSAGTASQIHKMFKLPDGSLRLIVQGLERLTLDEVIHAPLPSRARTRA